MNSDERPNKPPGKANGDPIEPPPLLQIVDWKQFECVALLNIDRAWRAMLCHPDGAAIYGNFSLLVEYCRCQPEPRDGWLTADGTPQGSRLTIEALSQVFRRPPEEIMRMLQVTTAVNWIRVVEGDVTRAIWLAELRFIGRRADSLPPDSFFVN